MRHPSSVSLKISNGNPFLDASQRLMMQIGLDQTRINSHSLMIPTAPPRDSVLGGFSSITDGSKRKDPLRSSGRPRPSRPRAQEESREAMLEAMKMEVEKELKNLVTALVAGTLGVFVCGLGKFKAEWHQTLLSLLTHANRYVTYHVGSSLQSFHVLWFTKKKSFSLSSSV